MKWLKVLSKFINKVGNDHTGAYAAQAAYYIMLSFVPFIMLLLSLIKYTPVTKAKLLEFVVGVFPTSINPLLTSIIEELFLKSVAIISVTAIIAMWSAAKGILSITAGFNCVYDVRETRNYFVLRLRSAAYTVVLIVLINVSMVVLVFGESLHYYFQQNFPFVADITKYILNLRVIVSIVIMTLLFTVMYWLIPNRRGIFSWQIPGAVFTSVGWNVFSYGFSFYLDKFSNMTYMYGSLTTIIIIMLWLYFSMFIMLLGAEVNACIEKYPFLREKLIRRNKRRERKKRKLQ